MAVKDKNSELVSKRWAKALMELVSEDEKISKEDVLKELKEIAETIESSEDLSGVLSNPSISTEEKQVVLCKLFQENKMPIVYNFIFALNLRKRVILVKEIAQEFEKELDRLKNITHVGVTSAIELNEDRKEDIKSKISSKLKKEITVNWDVDDGIIAGLVLNIDETIVDNSVRHKLEDISKNIIKS